MVVIVGGNSGIGCNCSNGDKRVSISNKNLNPLPPPPLLPPPSISPAQSTLHPQVPLDGYHKTYENQPNKFVQLIHKVVFEEEGGRVVEGRGGG